MTLSLSVVVVVVDYDKCAQSQSAAFELCAHARTLARTTSIALTVEWLMSESWIARMPLCFRTLTSCSGSSDSSSSSNPINLTAN